MVSQIRTIVSGPGIFDLAVRLFEGDNREQRSVTFTVREGGPGTQMWCEEIMLRSAEREDGSGKNWNLTGYNVVNQCLVKIFYSLARREGTMTFNP